MDDPYICRQPFLISLPDDPKYMQRCLDLALLAAGHTAPNPMVGAVLVFEDRIIGEGYHRQYGKAHAEVNCIASVKEEDLALLPRATLYVSLEPCAHFGKTPPCADLVIEKRIPRVVVGCRDPFPEVNGKGIEKLQSAGVEVVQGMLEAACIERNKRFFTFHQRHRPYIILKWAQSADRKISATKRAGRGGDMRPDRTRISNEYTNRLVHKWRSEEASILVGTQTALNDDPALTVRFWQGPNPVRLVLDKELRLPQDLRIFDGEVRTIIFNLYRHDEIDNLLYYQVAEDSSLVHQIVLALHQMKIQSVLVEGGAALLQSFIDEGYWDEARIITNEELELREGLAAPVLKGEGLTGKVRMLSDSIAYFKNTARP
jgi:diaminohydroxyphosphoribosylaminopyrimidine deaminase/5-amino-6-(5-phosphoribosylamino)uracil reductase